MYAQRIVFGVGVALSNRRTRRGLVWVRGLDDGAAAEGEVSSQERICAMEGLLSGALGELGAKRPKAFVVSTPYGVKSRNPMHVLVRKSLRSLGVEIAGTSLVGRTASRPVFSVDMVVSPNPPCVKIIYFDRRRKMDRSEMVVESFV